MILPLRHASIKVAFGRRGRGSLRVTSRILQTCLTPGHRHRWPNGPKIGFALLTQSQLNSQRERSHDKCRRIGETVVWACNYGSTMSGARSRFGIQPTAVCVSEYILLSS